LFDQVLAGIALHFAREEAVEFAVERVPAHRVFRTGQLAGETQAGAVEAPRGAGLADHLEAFGRAVAHRDRGESLPGVLAVVDALAEALLQLLGVGGSAPLERGDPAVDRNRRERRARLAGLGEQEADHLNRMAHHIVEHAAALLVALPEPRGVRPR